MRLRTIKKSSQIHKLRFFFVRPQNTWIFGWCYSQFSKDQRSEFNNEAFPKVFFGLKVLVISLSCVKRAFNRKSKYYLSGLKLFRFFYFW